VEAASAIRSSETPTRCARTSSTATSPCSALKDYGVVVRELDADLDEYDVDRPATERERDRIRSERSSWLDEDAEKVARGYRDGDLDVFDLVRQYGVIVDWGTGELLPRTTTMFRAMLQRRSVDHWAPVPAAAEE